MDFVLQQIILCEHLMMCIESHGSNTADSYVAIGSHSHAILLDDSSHMNFKNASLYQHMV